MKCDPVPRICSPFYHEKNHHQTNHHWGRIFVGTYSPSASKSRKSKVIYVYLEPQWPVFLKVNPAKQGLFQSKQGSLGFYLYMYMWDYLKPWHADPSESWKLNQWTVYFMVDSCYVDGSFFHCSTSVFDFTHFSGQSTNLSANVRPHPPLEIRQGYWDVHGA